MITQSYRAQFGVGLLMALAGFASAKAQAFCLPIDQINLSGVTLLEPAVLQEAISQFEGKCLGLPDLNSVLQVVTSAYVDEGYVTARAYLPEQNLADRSLDISVVEGELAGIRFNGKADAVWQSHSFPRQEGRPVNLRDIEQGLDVIRSMPSFSPQMELSPGERDGETILDVTAEVQKPWRIRLSANNYGLDGNEPGQAAATGQYISSIDFGYDHLFGRNESWTLRFSKSMPSNPLNLSYNGPGTQSAELGLSIPWGRTRAGLRAEFSEYKTTAPGASTTIPLTGSTATLSFNAEHLLRRDRDSKTWIDARLQYRDTENKVAGVVIDASSQRLTTLRLGLRHEHAALKGQVSLQAGIEKGLEWFGAEDGSSLPTGSPDPQFLRYDLSVSYGRGFELGDQSFAYRGQIKGQYSPDQLYGAYQISLGGQSSVRGAKSDVARGSSGVIWQNEISWNSPFTISNLGALQPYATLDLGRVASQRRLQVQDGFVAGASIGVRLVGGRLNLDASYGRLFETPTGVKRPDAELLVSLSTVF